LSTTFVFTQDAIDVTDQNISIETKSKRNIYFSFEAGDLIVVNLKERDDDKLSEFEILEYPSNSKFSDFKISKLENKKIKVPKRSIYQFRLKNTNRFGARICKIRIQRIPLNDKTKDFDTDVVFKDIIDSTKVIIEQKSLIKSDTSIINLMDEKTIVHSQLSLDGSKGKSVVTFTLPENTSTWSFYIGVGQEGKAAYQKAEKDLLKVASSVLISSLNPLSYFATTGISLFNNVSGPDHVYFTIIGDEQNLQNFRLGLNFNQYQEGDLISGVFKMSTIPEGNKCFLGLNNSNSVKPIEVTIKVTAVVINNQYETKSVEKYEIKSTKKPFLRN